MRKPLLVAWLALVVAPVASFVMRFDPAVNSRLVNMAWLGALVLWVGGVIVADPLPLRRRALGRSLGLLGALLAVYAACWFPFCVNWRWAGAGDSMPWFELPLMSARQGCFRSALSVHGPWDLFTYTQTLVEGWLMFVFEPTFFWFRAGKGTMVLLSLAAIYAFFTIAWNRWWAAAVAAGTGAHFLFIWLSYLNFPHVDSFIFSYTTLSAVALAVRDPKRWSVWMVGGVAGGLSLFFTQTAWADVLAGAVVLFGLALWRRAPGQFALYAFSGLLAGLPVLLQIEDMVRMQTSQAKAIWEADYLWRIFTAILQLPFGTDMRSLDINGKFFFWPWGWLYASGMAIALLGIGPPLRRGLRLPRAAAPLVLLFFWHVVLMTLTNNGYPAPSFKRTYHLLPLQIFFTLLPFYALAMLLRRWIWMERLVELGAVAALAVFVYGHAGFFAWPPVRQWGNVFDALVQVTQRFADREVVVLDSRPAVQDAILNPKTVWNEMYRMKDVLAMTGALDEPTVRGVCESRGVICYYSDDPANRQSFELATAPLAERFQPVTLYIASQLLCFECR